MIYTIYNKSRDVYLGYNIANDTFFWVDDSNHMWSYWMNEPELVIFIQRYNIDDTPIKRVISNDKVDILPGKVTDNDGTIEPMFQHSYPFKDANIQELLNGN